jgi:hypothetical protein
MTLKCIICWNEVRQGNIQACSGCKTYINLLLVPDDKENKPIIKIIWKNKKVVKKN